MQSDGPPQGEVLASEGSQDEQQEGSHGGADLLAELEEAFELQASC